MKINRGSDPLPVAAGLILLFVCLFFTGLALLEPFAGAWLDTAVTGEGCTFLRRTGFPCPGCGVSRSGLAFVQGKWALAWDQHPVLFIVSLSMVVLGYHAIILWFQRRPLLIDLKVFGNGCLLLLVLITYQWFWKCWVGIVS